MIQDSLVAELNNPCKRNQAYKLSIWVVMQFFNIFKKILGIGNKYAPCNIKRTQRIKRREIDDLEHSEKRDKITIFLSTT